MRVIRAAWLGGADPAVTSVAVADGASPAGPADPETLEELVDALVDLEFTVRAHADGPVSLSLGVGFTARLSGGFTARGSTTGPTSDARLAGPLELSFEDEGLSLALSASEWMARLARIHIQAASLRPDGTVTLASRDRGGVRQALQLGLDRVSSQLSNLVRTSPRFRRVRDYLPS